MVTKHYSLDPKSVISLEKERQWAAEFPDEWVLAYGDEVLGHAETAEEAWELAKPKMLRDGLTKAVIQQFYFDPLSV